jgi:hypothetical protein
MKNDDLPIYILLGIFGFFISVFIVRAIFSIPRMLDYFKAQTLLLAYLAEKNGVDIKVINKIRNGAGLGDTPNENKVE